MKSSAVTITFLDGTVTSVTEGNNGVSDLHAVYRDGMCMLNYQQANGTRINYEYPIITIDSVVRT